MQSNKANYSLTSLCRQTPLIPLAMALCLILSRFAPLSLSTDGHTYLQIARNIHLGAGLGWQASWVPPLHSILIALVGWLPGIDNLLLAAGIVGAVMGLLLVAGVWLLAAELFGPAVAFGAATITALFPHFLWIMQSPEAEITYTALLVLALWLCCLAVRRQSLLLAALTGLTFALAYLARSEGFLIMLLVIAALLLLEGPRLRHGKLLKLLALLLISFLIASLPYLLFLKKHYGALVISPKATYVLIWMKNAVYHDGSVPELQNEELWGLTASGKLKWQVPSSGGDLIAYLMSHPTKSARVYLHNLLGEVPGMIPNNSGMASYPQVFPVILALFALLAPLQKWGERSREVKAVVLAPLLILLILPLFTGGWWKYLVPYAPLIIILAAAGMASATQYPPLQRFKSSAAVFMLLIGVSFYLMANPVSLQPLGNRNLSPSIESIERSLSAGEQEKASRWIAAALGPGHNYMAEWSKLIFHLNGLWTAAPITTYRRLHVYAVHQGAEYFLEERDGPLPAAELLAARAPYGMEYVTSYSSDRTKYCVVVYRVVYPVNFPSRS